jgi:hypothetical protein
MILDYEIRIDVAIVKNELFISCQDYGFDAFGNL